MAKPTANQGTNYANHVLHVHVANHTTMPLC